MKLRLVLHTTCERQCEGCCNKQFDLDNTPYCEDYTPYELIMITGGEPMLTPIMLERAIKEIRSNTTAPMILYTAKTDDDRLIRIFSLLDGITVTLHDEDDITPFHKFSQCVSSVSKGKTLRLNVFKGVHFPFQLPYWQTKRNIEWINPCPLPIGEVLMKYKTRF